MLKNLESVKNVNVTKNKRTDLTAYPNEFYDITEMEKAVKFQLDNYYTAQSLDPIIEKDRISKISNKAYKQIISEINTFGKNLEKYKDLYSKFDEEGFRNFFMPHLNSISTNHTATAETFNKIGKTDILIQDGDGLNVFIAECKIWHGEAEFLKAIDQLLERYVTWRDEHVALIIFNKENKDFTRIIATAKKCINTHKSFDAIVDESLPTSISYIFRNSDDTDKRISLELILFNCS